MSKWAVVTGATVGIGESYARLLAGHGYNITLVARDKDRLHERAKYLEDTYKVETFVLPADLSTESGSFAVEKYLQDHDVEILVNNAGFGINKAFTVSDLAAEQALLDVLVRVPLRLTHIALRKMKARNSGMVINISSVASFIAGGTYSAAKSYLTVLSESLNTELANTNVRVCAVCPGFTRTEFHQRGRMRMSGLPPFLWLSADYVAEQGWKDALAGKAISIPARRYKAITFLARYAPRPYVRKIGMNLRTKQR